MEPNQLEKPSEHDRLTDRMAALTDAVKKLMKAVESQGPIEIEFAASEVYSASIRAGINGDLDSAIGFQLSTITTFLRHIPTKTERHCARWMVAAIENILEHEGNE